MIGLLTASIKEDTSSETKEQIEKVSHQLCRPFLFTNSISTYIYFVFNMNQLITMQAIDILKTTELYSPVFKEQGDPAAEFIEALITVMLKRKILSLQCSNYQFIYDFDFIFNVIRYSQKNHGILRNHL